MDKDKRVFKAEEVTLGVPDVKHKIVFKSVKELDEFKKALDDAQDLYVQEKNGNIILLRYKDINYQIYEQKVSLEALKLE